MLNDLVCMLNELRFTRMTGAASKQGLECTSSKP